MITFGSILEFGDKGRLWKNGEEFKGLLNLNITLVIISALVLLSVGYYLLKFLKQSVKNKYSNKKLITFTFTIILVGLLMSILNFIFYFSAASIFKEPKAARDAIIVCLVLGFTAIFASMILLWIKLPYYVLMIDDSRIWFLGESLAFTKITKIIEDDNNQKIYINYIANHRTFKNYHLKSSSNSAQFLRENLPKNFVIEHDNQGKYFQDLNKTPPKLEQ